MPPTDDDPNNSYVFRSEDDGDEGRPATAGEDVDLQALAEEVYALLKRELWLERERWGGHRTW